MANSNSNIDTIVHSQAQKEVTANAFFDAASQAATFARRASTSTGLTWGYYGGNFTKPDGTMVQVANGTLTLTASATNYITVLRSTGVVYSSITSTAWDDVYNYLRLYSVVTGTATVTSYTDAREIGRFAQDRREQAPVSKTAAFTWGDLDDFIVCNGTASITATLPDAGKFPGRALTVKTIAAFPVVSASSIVVPIGSNTAGTAILDGIIGRWAVLVSDGSNWIITQTGGNDLNLQKPVTKTGDFTVALTENELICNGTATINVTMPAAASYPGRRVRIKTIAAFTVVSVASNIVPIASATAGTAILAATAGKWAELVSDGTNWVIMATG